MLLHEPIKRRFPATAGVENTQPPVSNCQSMSGSVGNFAAAIEVCEIPITNTKASNGAANWARTMEQPFVPQFHGTGRR